MDKDRKEKKIAVNKLVKDAKLGKRGWKELNKLGTADVKAKKQWKEKGAINTALQNIKDQGISNIGKAESQAQKKNVEEKKAISDFVKKGLPKHIANLGKTADPKLMKKAEQLKSKEEGELLSKARERDQEFTDKQDKDKAKDSLIMKRELQARARSKGLAPEVKKVKKEKSWWGKMPDKDKAGIIFGAGKGLLDARAQHLKEKQARRQRIAAGRRLGAATEAKAAQQLIGSAVSLRKGGRVSFKDVLKAKKKMGY